MNSSNGVIIDENIIKSLGAHAAKIIRIKSAQMEAEIAKKLQDLESRTFEGYSTDELVKATVNGNRQITEFSFAPSYTEWNDKAKTSALIMEAVNDAIYQMDLAIETEISTIKYQFVCEVIQETEKKD